MYYRFFSIVLLLCAAWALSASPITYDISVNTSSISGTSGSLDFQFNPGPLVSQAASLQILSFLSNGTLSASPTLTGDVSGGLPGTLTFDNGTGLNDYFQGFTYGSTLSFSVKLFGPALSSPDGISTSGSRFAFSMFSDAGGTVPALTSDTANGFAFTTDVNLDGTTTALKFSRQTSILPEGAAVPEPASFGLAAAALIILALKALWVPSGHRRTSLAAADIAAAFPR